MIDLPPIETTTNVVTYEMIERAARLTETPILGLYLILKVEGGTVGECNATNDCGPFQVNRQHYNDLEKYGLSRSLIINNAYGNTLAAAIIFRQKLNVCGAYTNYDWFDKLACYHSFTPKFRLKYRTKLIKKAEKLLPPKTINRFLANGG
ncbi:hypothetical protein [uncultured Amphritea sp.]|uniref:hypothetical protein n=1 Tax=uncultured Amphritea sp. TaxID=981605 RepID=UPI00263281C4|nr:hypothetical protein [uncultured Amphritea sp.]